MQAAPVPEALGTPLPNYPNPDGCYANFTLAEGCNALANLGAGIANSGAGWYSLFSTVDNSFNTGFGGGTLALNGADNNTATGAGAMLLNTTGHDNTANGTKALEFNDSGNFDNAVGSFALFNNTGGAGSAGSFNNAHGGDALFSNVIGADNTAMGDLALAFNDSDGTGAANANTGVGSLALFGNVDGSDNAAVGFNAIGANTTGFQNEAMGSFALSSNNTGSFNVAIGDSALSSNVAGDWNTIVGWNAGLNLEGTDNIYIGDSAGIGVAAESFTIRLGNPAFVTDAYIAGIVGTIDPAAVTPVFISPTGHLSYGPSSERFKKDIKPMQKASESIYSLKPVTFHYKTDAQGKFAEFGLIAEDVEKVNPDLVGRDTEGKVTTVRYEAVNAMLLNEFLKEHQTVQELKATTEKQQATIAALTASLRAQASQIQKVSAQLEMIKPAPQMVENR